MKEKALLDAFHKWLACRILLQAVRDLRNPTQQWGNGHRMEATQFLQSPDATLWAKIAGCENDPAQVPRSVGQVPLGVGQVVKKG